MIAGPLRRPALALALAGAALAPSARAQEVTREVGRVVLRVDTRHGFPGGLLLVRASASTRLGGVSVVFDGRRTPLWPAGGLLRGLVPVPLGTSPGDHTLGFEIAARRGRQRVPLDVPIVPREYPSRAAVLPAVKLGLVTSRDALKDGRRVLLALRSSESASLAAGPLLAPVAGATGVGFGSLQIYPGLGRPVEVLKDAIFGEEHRGLDYDVPVGTPVLAPAAGKVLLATWLSATGWTVLLDHGEGLVSALFHLSSVSVSAGAALPARAELGRSGDSGLASHPHVHWGVYVYAVAVDPAVLMQGWEP